MRNDRLLLFSTFRHTLAYLKQKIAAAGSRVGLVHGGASLYAIVSRLVDLLPIVRGAVYFPEFNFTNSIKFVAPALCPGFGYDCLEEIADGGAASAAFLRLASGHVTQPGEADHIRAALLAYCKRDTLALFEVH
jgi:hypothetical protein